MLLGRHRDEGKPQVACDRDPTRDDIADALYIQDLVLQAEATQAKSAAGRSRVISQIALAAVLGIAAVLSIVVA